MKIIQIGMVLSIYLDFGDATPLSKEPSPWHYMTILGLTRYLTVRDSYGTGDVSKQSFTIVVDEPPQILRINIPEEIIAGESTYLSANITDYEMNNNVIVYRDLNVEDGSLFDKDETLNTEITVRWDINTQRDTNKNGILVDDWIEPKETAVNYRIEALWNESTKFHS